MRFSILMSVYKMDCPEHLKIALESIYEKQIVKPDEIVVVFDGPLTSQLLEVLEQFKSGKENIVFYYPQKINMGLGEALRIGSEKCTGDYIVRMDSDDISCSNRLKVQIDYLTQHGNIDVLGSDIAEFMEKEEESNKRIRRCEAKHENIARMSKKRNPMNHVTVCIKRNSLINAGGYLSLKYVEDYYLWIRMINQGYKFENINEVLVNVRIGNGFATRRSNKCQINNWKVIQEYMLENKMINKINAFQNMIRINAFVRMPVFLKKIVYSLFLRKRG